MMREGKPHIIPRRDRIDVIGAPLPVDGESREELLRRNTLAADFARVFSVPRVTIVDTVNDVDTSNG